MALALAICLTGLAVSGWADRRSEGSPAANRALVDKAATAEAVTEVSNGVARIFTYVHTDPAATERAAKEILTGRAASQYRSLFGQVRQQAPVMKLSSPRRSRRRASSSSSATERPSCWSSWTSRRRATASPQERPSRRSSSSRPATTTAGASATSGPPERQGVELR
ncbi:hypothetical protein ACFQHO_13890 [Actinomadura yumaensis]|uniref:hypothetical protein n=1 Tax=Actinomadura yumaensis TaxID=111807 RepID=UPI003622A720